MTSLVESRAMAESFSDRWKLLFRRLCDEFPDEFSGCPPLGWREQMSLEDQIRYWKLKYELSMAQHYLSFWAGTVRDAS